MDFFGSSFLSLCSITRTVTKNCYWGYTKVNPLESSYDLHVTMVKLKNLTGSFVNFFHLKMGDLLLTPLPLATTLNPPPPPKKDRIKKNT